MVGFPGEIPSTPPTPDLAEVGFFVGSPAVDSGTGDTMVEMSIQELLVSELLPVVTPWPEPFLLDSKRDLHSSLDLSSPGEMHLLPLTKDLVSS